MRLEATRAPAAARCSRAEIEYQMKLLNDSTHDNGKGGAIWLPYKHPVLALGICSGDSIWQLVQKAMPNAENIIDVGCNRGFTSSLTSRTAWWFQGDRVCLETGQRPSQHSGSLQ